MANTWTLYCQAVSFAATKNMNALLNGGANILRVRRVGMLNTQTVAVAGVVCQTDFQRMTVASFTVAHTAVAPVAHDTANAALDTVSAGYSGTLAPGGGGVTDTFRRFIWSSDEPSASAATSDEWECLVPLNIVWDCGYADSNLQALVLRADEAARLYNQSGAAGLLDSWMEFTDEAP